MQVRSFMRESTKTDWQFALTVQRFLTVIVSPRWAMMVWIERDDWSGGLRTAIPEQAVTDLLTGRPSKVVSNRSSLILYYASIYSPNQFHASQIHTRWFHAPLSACSAQHGIAVPRRAGVVKFLLINHEFSGKFLTFISDRWGTFKRDVIWVDVRVGGPGCPLEV